MYCIRLLTWIYTRSLGKGCIGSGADFGLTPSSYIQSPAIVVIAKTTIATSGAMDHQQVNNWNFQSWNEDTIDPSWFDNFLATDVGQDATNAASDAPAAFSIDDDLAIEPNFHDFTLEDTLQPLSGMTSPSYPFDAYQPTEFHERPQPQRHHTLPRRRSKYFKRRSTGTVSPMVIPSGSPRHE